MRVRSRARTRPLQLPALGVRKDLVVRVEVVVCREWRRAAQALVDEDTERPVIRGPGKTSDVSEMSPEIK